MKKLLILAALVFSAICLKAQNAKTEKALFYINGLLENGGPSTDVFVKGIGKERTTELFHNILFGM